jgi:hypothetical protein
VKRAMPLIAWLVAAPALCAAGAEFEARLWAPDVSGVAQVGDGGAPTAIDLVSDLGLGDDETLAGRLIWRPTRRTFVRLDYSSFDFAGDARLDRPISFSGTSFQLEAQVASVLELEYGGLGLGWQLLSTSDGRLRLGPLVEARGLRGEARISADVLGTLTLDAREEFELGYAAAGLALDVEPSRRVHVYAVWTTTVQLDEGDLTDAELGLRFYPLDSLALTVGYRRLDIEARDGNEVYDLQLDGPFFGGVLRF